MSTTLNIGLIDTPLSRTPSSSHIHRWPGGPELTSSNYLAHADINVGLLLGSESVESTPILPECNIYLAEAVQDSNLTLRLLEGLEWMIEQPVNVVAMPFGEHHGSPFMIPLIQQLLDRDILPVAAIGNKGAGQFSAPGCYQGVLSVGGTDESGEVAPYSGSLNLPDGKCLKPEVLMNGAVITDHRTMQGTSFATTKLAGHLAILRDKYPNVNYQHFINLTYVSCNPVSAEFKHRCVHGVLNTERLKGPLKNVETLAPQTLTIPGKFTDPFLLRQMQQSPPDKILDAIVCPKNSDLAAYPDIEVVKSFANDQILVIKALVSTLLMMHTQPDILVLQSQEIPPISILQLR
ncbi:MAG: S8 family serine peptidase [Cytophagales bacterium]|nr:S8 family serine peptidase [Cytophagales bacterium]